MQRPTVHQLRRFRPWAWWAIALRLAPGSKVRVLCRPVANDNAWADRELYREQVRWWGVAAE